MSLDLFKHGDLSESQALGRATRPGPSEWTLPGTASDPAGLRAATTDAAHEAPSSPAGETFTVTLGPNLALTLRMVAACHGSDINQAVAGALLFYAQHEDGLGMPRLLDARGDLTDLPDFDRARVARPARQETRGPP